MTPFPIPEMTPPETRMYLVIVLDACGEWWMAGRELEEM